MDSAMFALVPEIITAHTVLTVALISFVLAVIFALLAVGTEILFLGRRTESLLAGVILLLRTWVQLFGFTFPASLIGYISGYLATMNRTSAIGTILPAVLALIGGLNIYIFGTENRYRYVITRHHLLRERVYGDALLRDAIRRIYARGGPGGSAAVTHSTGITNKNSSSKLKFA